MTKYELKERVRLRMVDAAHAYQAEHGLLEWLLMSGPNEMDLYAREIADLVWNTLLPELREEAA